MKRIRDLCIVAIFLAGSAWGDSDVATSDLERNLSEAQTQTQLWSNLWGVTWGVATGAQAIVGTTTSNQALREDMMVGAIGTALGLIPTWIAPPQILRSNGSHESAEQRLEEYAASDRQYSSAWVHASNVFVNGAIGLILGWGFGHWSTAGFSMAAGIPVGELMILTYPSSAEKLRENRSRVSTITFLDRTAIRFAPVPGGGMAGVSVGF